MTVDVEELLVRPGATIRDVMLTIDRGARGIALLVDDERRLLGTVTDGDVRRAILAHLGPEEPVERLLERREREAQPLTAPADTPHGELLHLMTETDLRHIPLVDGDGRETGIAFLPDLVKEYDLPLTAVVMSGGLGTRLGELTQDLPKPMLPVGDRPLLEHIVDQLRTAGIRRVNLTTHYKRDVVSDHFGDGSRFGVAIEYVEEEHPLGTAGSLSRIRATDDPLLVINGDVLTRVDFRAMLDFHRDHGADMTVAVQLREFQVPYGVVQAAGEVVEGIVEKPVLRHFINAGIYLLSPGVTELVPHAERYDMPDLIRELLSRERPVVCFPIREYWLDIGQVEDYRRAVLDVGAGET